MKKAFYVLFVCFFFTLSAWAQNHMNTPCPYGGDEYLYKAPYGYEKFSILGGRFFYTNDKFEGAWEELTVLATSPMTKVKFQKHNTTYQIGFVQGSGKLARFDAQNAVTYFEPVKRFSFALNIKTNDLFQVEFSRDGMNWGTPSILKKGSYNLIIDRETTIMRFSTAKYKAQTYTVKSGESYELKWDLFSNSYKLTKN